MVGCAERVGVTYREQTARTVMYGDDVRDLEPFQLRVVFGVAVVAYVKTRQDLQMDPCNKHTKECVQEVPFPYASSLMQ